MKLGFIGTGNMATAIMGGVIKNEIIAANEIIGSDLFAPSREKVKENRPVVSQVGFSFRCLCGTTGKNTQLERRPLEKRLARRSKLHRRSRWP